MFLKTVIIHFFLLFLELSRFLPSQSFSLVLNDYTSMVLNDNRLVNKGY